MEKSTFSIPELLFSEPELLAFAKSFTNTLPSYGVVALWGDLGAGKTTFARHIIQTLANDPDYIVPSPTFNLVQVYDFNAAVPKEVWHCDFYRLSNPDECLELGILEATQHALCFIEWPENMGHYLPKKRTDIRITIEPDDRRYVTITHCE
jgi:tRNA threonylcarbamoyladenosine biosynthesis protein TsaE